MDEQDTELKKSVVQRQSVLLCLSCLFMYILTSKFIKKWKKIKQAKKKKIKSLNFADQTHTKKQMRVAALRHTIFFFFSVSLGLIVLKIQCILFLISNSTGIKIL